MVTALLLLLIAIAMIVKIHNNGGKNDDDDSNVDFKLAFDCFQFLQTQRRKCCLTDFFSSSIFIFNVVYRLALVSSYGEPVPSAQLLKC